MLNKVCQVASDDKVRKSCGHKCPVTIASDGGLKGNKGTFGWTVFNAKNEVLLEGAGPVDGPYDVNNSTRCKLAGYTASLLFLSLLQSLWGKHRCKFRWVTDSKAAISNVNKTLNDTRVNKTQPNNPDLLAIIKHETKNLRRRIKPIWVKGHQHNNGKFSTVQYRQDVDSNNKADKLATWYREESGGRQSQEKVDHVKESIISISINGKHLVSHVEACIRYHIDGYHLRQYAQSLNKWSNKTWDSINIEILGIFITRLDTTNQIARTKFMYDQWHTGIRRHQVATVKDPHLLLCPCCKAVTETTSHVLRCLKNPAREKSIKDLMKDLSPSDHHSVFSLIKTGAMNWLNSDDRPLEMVGVPTKFQESAAKGINDQVAIGWEAAFKGFLSVELRYMASIGMYAQTLEPHEGRGIQNIPLILKAFHKYTQSVWTARNKELHGSQDTDTKRIRDTETVEIIDLHGHPESLPAGDRHYCEQSLDKLLKKAPSTRRRWLRHMRVARLRFNKEGQRQALMTSFFSQTTRMSDSTG